MLYYVRQDDQIVRALVCNRRFDTATPQIKASLAAGVEVVLVEIISSHAATISLEWQQIPATATTNFQNAPGRSRHAFLDEAVSRSRIGLLHRVHGVRVVAGPLVHSAVMVPVEIDVGVARPTR